MRNDFHSHLVAMKKLSNFVLIIFGVAMVTGCTAIPDVGTRVYVYDQVQSVQPGNTPEQVQYLLNGPPHAVSIMQMGLDMYELWEYRVGNFLHAKGVMILFKNNRVLAIPQNGYELIQVLNAEGIVPQARFWNRG